MSGRSFISIDVAGGMVEASTKAILPENTYLVEDDRQAVIDFFCDVFELDVHLFQAIQLRLRDPDVTWRELAEVTGVSIQALQQQAMRFAKKHPRFVGLLGLSDLEIKHRPRHVEGLPLFEERRKEA